MAEKEKQPDSGIDIADNEPHADEFYEGLSENDREIMLDARAGLHVRETWLRERPDDIEQVPSDVIADPRSADDVEGVIREYVEDWREVRERLADEAGDVE
ncbi:hypothetical protein [Halostella salina]|uniref:hypothetical protein n=1 Tax=Halostella salina TaxID=1547897 RepID=UPI000EF8254A|nr:hypothetical protein [Halostella salina]